MRLLEGMGADRHEGEAIVRSLLTGTAEAEFPRVAARPEAMAFVEAAALNLTVIRSVIAESAACGVRDLHKYAVLLSTLLEHFVTRPNPHAWSLLCKHARHCERISEELQGRRVQGSYARVVLNLLSEDTARATDGISTLGSTAGFAADPDKIDADLEKAHDKFVAALEKQLGFKAVRWEPMREGLAVFASSEETPILVDAFAVYNEVLENVLDKHGYILVSHNFQQDVGGQGSNTYPTAESRWLFIRCPQGVLQQPEALEIKDPRKLK